MKKNVLSVVAASFILLFLITCGTRDDRDKIRADFGDPDRIITQGIDPFWRETWFYDSLGVAFEFRRTSGCGSLRDVYLYQQYRYVPSPSDTTRNSNRNLENILRPKENPISPY